MLDMQGKWERPKPIRPPLAPKTSEGNPEEPGELAGGDLERKLARVSRISNERGQKLEQLKGQLKRREARISSLEELLKDERADLGGTRRAEKAAGTTIKELRAEIGDRDKRLRVLHSRLVDSQAEAATARKALTAIQLRAHDWLELREGKRVIREIGRESA